MDAKEVWRLVSVNPEIPDPEECEVVSESLPDEFQMDQMHSCFPGGRLKFVPHALLRPPGNLPTRAFRFVYPTLFVAASNSLLLWDVRTGKLVECIGDIQSQMPPHAVPNSVVIGRICYVEVNEKYAFVCGDKSFKIFQRRGPKTDTSKSEDSNNVRRKANCVLAIIGSQLRRRGKWYMRLGYVKQEDLPVGFEDWRTRESYLEAEEDTDEPELEDEPMVTDWAAEAADDMEEEEEEEEEDNIEVIESGSNSQSQNFVPAGTGGRLHPRISMWKNSGKAVISHETELMVSSSSARFHDDLAGYCVAGTPIQNLHECHILTMLAHVSPCGQHLAILVQMSRLLIIPYFERVMDGTVKDYHDIMIDIQLGAPLQSIYLAYEDGRIGVVTVSRLSLAPGRRKF
jgi:hypothetical protein